MKILAVLVFAILMSVNSGACRAEAPPSEPARATGVEQPKPHAGTDLRTSETTRQREGNASTSFIPPKSGGGLDGAIAGINSANVDYGGILAEWRLALVRVTIENLFYWLSIAMTCTAIMLSVYLLFLVRQRQQRFSMSADMMRQLFNAWVFASNHARATIDSHNDWVEQLDREHESQLRNANESVASGGAAGVDVSTKRSSLGTPAGLQEAVGLRANSPAIGNLEQSDGGYRPIDFPTSKFAAAYFAAKGAGQNPPTYDPILHSDAPVDKTVAANAALEKVNFAAKAQLTDQDAPSGGSVEEPQDTVDALKARMRQLEQQIKASNDKAESMRVRLNSEKEKSEKLKIQNAQRPGSN